VPGSKLELSRAGGKGFPGFPDELPVVSLRHTTGRLYAADTSSIRPANPSDAAGIPYPFGSRGVISFCVTGSGSRCRRYCPEFPAPPLCRQQPQGPAAPALRGFAAGQSDDLRFRLPVYLDYRRKLPLWQVYITVGEYRRFSQNRWFSRI
jgi:hypothetical protein